MKLLMKIDRQKQKIFMEIEENLFKENYMSMMKIEIKNMNEYLKYEKINQQL